MKEYTNINDIEEMVLNNIIGPYNKKRKRVGRGIGSGSGKTSGKGHKGQRSRAGARRSNVFQGGQMPLERRLPKRGFNPLNRKEYFVINIQDIEYLKERNPEMNQLISIQSLIDHKIIKKGQLVKVLSKGEVVSGIRIEAHKVSATALEKIKAASGEVLIID